MKNRKLRLVAEVSGFPTTIAEVKIQNFASEVDVKDWTDLVCPSCGKKPKYVGGYDCDCGEHYGHWSKLTRVIRGTVNALGIPRLLKPKEEAVARLYYIQKTDFAEKYVDATRKDNGEKGVVLTDNASANNIFKLLVAIEELGYIIIAKWNDTNEEVIGLLTVSMSGRIIIREIVPSNLVEVKETLFLDRNAITQQDIDEAKAFVQHFIPIATPEIFEVSDYRASWKEGEITVSEEPQQAKVADIREIMKAMNK